MINWAWKNPQKARVTNIIFTFQTLKKAMVMGQKLGIAQQHIMGFFAQSKKQLLSFSTTIITT